jgi:hypothetical protein
VNDGSGDNKNDSPTDWGGQAAGGPNAPYTSRLVGENGPEIIHFGAIGGQVGPSVPAAMGPSAGGSPLVLQVNLDGRTVAEIVAPGVTAWQQNRQLLSRA